MKKRQRIFIKVIFYITAIELLFNVVQMIFAEDQITSLNIITVVACSAMLALIFVPVYTKKLFKRVLPPSMYIMFVTFCFCGLFLGDVKIFYAHFEHWDTLLHFISGMMLAVLGFILVNTLNDSDKTKQYVKLSPFFVAAVAFCFVMTIQSLWEIGEFLTDEWFNLNSQTYMETTTGTVVMPEDIPLVGHEALRDTMSDFMLDGLGGLIVCIIGYFNLKHNKKSFSDECLDKVVEPEEKDADDGGEEK